MDVPSDDVSSVVVVVVALVACWDAAWCTCPPW